MVYQVKKGCCTLRGLGGCKDGFGPSKMGGVFDNEGGLAEEEREERKERKEKKRRKRKRRRKKKKETRETLVFSPREFTGGKINWQAGIGGLFFFLFFFPRILFFSLFPSHHLFDAQSP